MTIALIDGDLVAYRCAASAENNEADIALIRASRTLQDIVSVTNANEAKVFLSGSRNFRYDLYPEYKANRKDMVRPRHLETVREYLVIEWGATVTDGIEADDAIGIEAGPVGSGNIMASLDKDFKQIAGTHYNFVTGQFDEVTELEGYRNFYKQLLTGDRADNIPGIRGIGKVRSERLIRPLQNPGDMYRTVQHLYKDDEVLLRNARLLYIWRKENDQWSPPGLSSSEGKAETEQKLESMTTMLEETIRSTGPTGTKRKKRGSRSSGRKKGS